MFRFASFVFLIFIAHDGAATAELARIKYNNPGLTVDLGVGLWAWPLPMDYDGDGDLDLVVTCPDKPYSGTYFFENPGTKEKPSGKMPVFLPGKRIADAVRNVQLSYVAGKPVVMAPGVQYTDFPAKQFGAPTKIEFPVKVHPSHQKLRANQWKLVDYGGDGVVDIVAGVGEWTEYGWDNAFNEKGEWTRGPLHGYVYWLKNIGTNAEPKYRDAVKLEAGGKPLDVYGMPSPNMADFDGDRDLDLICGEFLDGFTYFENTGTRKEPKFADGRRLVHAGKPLHMDLQMITPVTVDWDGDGDMDLICGDEDGRVAFIEHAGKVENGVPVFLPPKYFQQQADDVKFGALVTPVSFDWDLDGDEDLICGNTAGYIGFIENLDGGNPPKWAAPKYLESEGKPIRYLAGPNGSIQGPCEAKWGYTTLSVADWDHDGLPDIVVNSIWGRVEWIKNLGPLEKPKLAAPRPVAVAWEGKPPKPAWNWWSPKPTELSTQWRTTPIVIDWNRDKLSDLVSLDHEGYLSFFERKRDEAGKLILLPGKRVFHGEKISVYDSRHRAKDMKGGLLRLNDGTAGASGRRKLAMIDWNADGKVDLLVNSVNVNLLTQVSSDGGKYAFRDEGPMGKKALAGHTTSPTVVDWNRDGVPELLVGAEDGFLYYLPREKSE